MEKGIITKNINTDNNTVNERTIGDAWRTVMWLCVRNGYDYIVEKGSYAGQIRRQLSDVKIVISEPGTRPLAPDTPPNTPPVTTDDKIWEYFVTKLTEDKLGENEQYVYGTWIKPQLPIIIDKLIKSHGNTNQACINIGDSSSVLLDDPPCLRVIDFKVIRGRLNMSVFFRSWDLIAGFPQNLGGLQLLKEYVCLGVGLEDGKIIAYSDGLHIYEQYFDIVDVLNTDKIKVSKEIREEKEKFAKILDGDQKKGKKD